MASVKKTSSTKPRWSLIGAITPAPLKTQERLATIYFHAFFSTAYKEDERIITQIVTKNVKSTDPEKKINLQIYYRNKASHFLLRNSPHRERGTTHKSHAVYKFTCKRRNCKVLPSTYIGMTTTKLSRRLTCHLTSGAPRIYTYNSSTASKSQEKTWEKTSKF